LAGWSRASDGVEWSLSTNRKAPPSSSDNASAAAISARACFERNHSPRLPPTVSGRRLSAVQDICGQASAEKSQSQVTVVVMTGTCGRPGRLVARVGGFVAVFAALLATQARADPPAG
jgi:hypothetical protein